MQKYSNISNGMKTNKQTLITLILTIILLGLLGFYIFNDLKNKSNDNQSDNQNIATTTDEISKILEENGIEIEGGNYKIEQVPVDEIVVPKPIPNLDAPIKNNSKMTVEALTIIENKIKELVGLLKNNPADFNSWIALGIRAKTLENYDKTIEFWEYAIRLNPDNKVSYSNLGDLYHYFLKDYVKAEKYLLTALEKDPNYIMNYTNLHDLYRYSYKQDTNEAVNILLKGLKLYPNELNLLVPLATYYKDKGYKEKAIEYYDKAIEQAKKEGNLDLSSELQKEVLLLSK